MLGPSPDADPIPDPELTLTLNPTLSRSPSLCLSPTLTLTLTLSLSLTLTPKVVAAPSILEQLMLSEEGRMRDAMAAPKAPRPRARAASIATRGRHGRRASTKRATSSVRPTQTR